MTSARAARYSNSPSPRSERKLTEVQIQGPVGLYMEGFSLAIVDEKFGVDAATIRRELDLAGGQHPSSARLACQVGNF